MKRVTLFLLFMSGYFITQAQIRRANTPRNTRQSDNFWQPEKIILGGNIGPLFLAGTENMIGMNALTGYRVTENFWPGISFNYINYSSRFIINDLNGTPTTTRYSLSSVGTGLFLRYRLFNFIMPSVELERNWMIEKTPYLDFASNKVMRERNTFGSSSLLVGAGIYRGSNTQGSYILLLYDLLYRNNKITPYNNNLTLKVGFMMSEVFSRKK